ncbi:MAG: hypothetical protein J6K39_02135 [Clostridia bacterium]|nr:hypothetical protein [Clostridia bacterium]
MNKVDQCIILMAGKGTRFLPATKAVAKELFPIANKPALLYHLEECYKSGIKRVCIVISKEKEYVKQFLKHDKNLETALKNTNKMHLIEGLNKIIDNMEIDFVYQGKINGSGGAIMSTKKWTKGKPFAMINGDDLCIEENFKVPAIKELIDVYEKTGKIVLGTKTFPMEIMHLYSSVVKGKEYDANTFEVKQLIEKPEKGKAPTNLVSLARYVFTADIFDEIPKCPKFANGEVRYPDAVNILAEQGKVVCHEFDAKYYDCGNKLEFIKCTLDFALQDEEISAKLKEHLKTLI